MAFPDLPRPTRGSWHYHPHLRMAASQPQIGPQLMTVTTNSKHFWGQLPPYGSRNYHSPVPRCLYTAIPPTRRPLPYVPGPLGLQMFQSVLDLSPPGSKATAKMVARSAIGLPQLGMCLAVIPALQSLLTHSYSIG
jgi:hypothetical protein